MLLVDADDISCLKWGARIEDHGTKLCEIDGTISENKHSSLCKELIAGSFEGMVRVLDDDEVLE